MKKRYYNKHIEFFNYKKVIKKTKTYGSNSKQNVNNNNPLYKSGIG